jgi:hypothetical protein
MVLGRKATVVSSTLDAGIGGKIFEGFANGNGSHYRALAVSKGYGRRSLKKKGNSGEEIRSKAYRFGNTRHI